MRTFTFRMVASLLVLSAFLYGAFGYSISLWLFPQTTIKISNKIDNRVETLLNPPTSAEELEQIKTLKEIEPLTGVILYQSYHRGDNGQQIYKTTYVYNGRQTTSMTTDGAIYVKISTDGTMIAYTKPQYSGQSEGKGLWIQGVDGSKAIQICSMEIDEYLNWSPDDKWIVFASPDWLNSGSIPGARYSSAHDIYAVSIETGEIIRLTTEGGRSPVYSPDGEEIYFVSGRNRNDDEEIKQDIFKMKPDGSEQAPILIEPKAGDTTPSPVHLSLSPNGQWIVFDAYTANEQIYKITIDGTHLTALAFVSQDVRNKHPDWSDQGIVFTSARNYEPWTIYTMDDDGNNVKKIGDGINHSTHPSWSPP